MEFTSAARLAPEFNGSAHGVHNTFCDCHSQTRALRSVHLGSLLPRKCVKNRFLEFRCHADSAVPDPEMASYIMVPQRRSLLTQIYIDRALFRREFHRVGQKIDQHLIQTYTVAVYFLCLYILYKNIKMLLPRLNLRLYNIDDAVHRLMQRHLIQIQRQLSALDLGHVQNVIDQSQQMPAGQCNLYKTVPDPRRILNICHGNRRHAYDAVHRRPDIMTHVGEELALCPVCLYGCLLRSVQLPKLLLRHPVIQHKDHHHCRQNDAARPKHGVLPLLAEVFDGIIQRSVRHDRHQIPLGTGKRRTVKMPVRSLDHRQSGIVHIRIDRIPKLLRILFRRPSGKFPKQLFHTGKIIIPVRLSAPYDEGSVLMDNMIIYHGICFLQNKRRAQLFHGNPDHQKRTPVPIFHRIFCMDGQQKDLVSVLIITAGDILAFILQNPLKFVPVNSLHTSAVYMFASAVLCIESEVCKSADFCILRFSRSS